MLSKNEIRALEEYKEEMRVLEETRSQLTKKIMAKIENYWDDLGALNEISLLVGDGYVRYECFRAISRLEKGE